MLEGLVARPGTAMSSNQRRLCVCVCVFVSVSWDCDIFPRGSMYPIYEASNPKTSDIGYMDPLGLSEM